MTRKTGVEGSTVGVSTSAHELVTLLVQCAGAIGGPYLGGTPMRTQESCTQPGAQNGEFHVVFWATVTNDFLVFCQLVAAERGLAGCLPKLPGVGGCVVVVRLRRCAGGERMRGTGAAIPYAGGKLADGRGSVSSKYVCLGGPAPH